MSIGDQINQAIERSAFHNLIQNIFPESRMEREQACDELSWRCEDGTEFDGVSEYWGTDESGRNWRVNVYPVDVASVE